MLLHCPNFSPFAPLHPATPTPSGNLHTIIHIDGSCAGSLATLLPMLYCTSPWLLCNYLFVLLNLLTSSPIPSHASSHLTIIKMLSVSMIMSLSFLFAYFVFLDSTVDKYGCFFLAMLLFIAFIFFFLNKSL